MDIKLAKATEAEAPAIAELHMAVAEALSREYGRGHWSSAVSERGVLYSMRIASVLVARVQNKVVGTLQLATKKPWAIDRAYFAACKRPLYLTAMAVLPGEQRQGIGAGMLEQAKEIVREWPGDAIRLDAYDAAAGAGGFYAKCGFREVGRVVYRGTPLIYFEMML